MGMSAAGSTGRKQQPVPTVNVTPLVDVALVVLIIFMVVTPLMTKTFFLNLPTKDDKAKSTPPQKAKNQPLVMTLDKDGVIRINKTVLTKEDLTERLPRFLAANKHKVLYFDAHDSLPYGKAVEAMDASRLGGARSIAILTQPIAK